MPLHARHSTATLRNLSFFERWNDDELEHFERIAGRATFAAGDALICEGKSGHPFMIVVAGEAEVIRDGQSLGRLGPGDHAGEFALLDDSPAIATVVARTDGELLTLHQRDFHNLLETIPSLGRRILATLTALFRETARQDS